MAFRQDSSTGAPRRAIRCAGLAVLALLTTALGSLVLAASAAASADTIPTYSFSQLAFPAGTLGEPLGLATAPTGTTLYLSDRTNGVMAIDTANVGGTPIQITDAGNYINGLAGPASLALSPDGKTLYMAFTLVDDIAVADVSGESGDATDYTVTRIIQGPTSMPLTFPYGLAVSPNGDTLYVSNYDSNTVFIVDISGDANNDTVIGELVDPRGYLNMPTDLHR